MKGAALAGLLLAASAHAQVPEGRTDELGRLPYEQLRRQQTELHFGAVRTLRDANAGVEQQTENAVAFLAVSRGFGERLELGVALPYVLASDLTTTHPSGVRTESTSGVGDPTLRARYALGRGPGGVAVTLGLLATPDWGGPRRGLGAQTGSVEPFVVLGKPIDAGTQAYLRYGYAYRSGDTPEAHRLSLGGRRALAPGHGVLGWIGYTRTLASDTLAAQGVWRGALGAFVSLPDALQLVLWAGISRDDGRENAGRIEDASGRQMGLSLIRRL